MSTSRSIEPQAVDELLDARDLERARAALDAVEASDRRFDVLRIRLAFYEGSLPPQAAVQELIKVMRRDESFPGARELYQEASDAAYAAGQSSVAQSHPPPPVRRGPSGG